MNSLARYLNSKTFWILLRIMFGASFVFSGLMKLIDLHGFELALGKFKLLDDSTLPIVKFLVPMIEVVLGTLLVAKVKPVLISQMITWLVIFFTAVIVSKVSEGEELSCNCFGNLSTGKIDHLTILRNIILILVGIGLTIYFSFEEKKDATETKKQIFFSPNNLIVNFWWKQLKQIALVAVFFFLAVLSVILSMQNRGLKENISLLMTNNEILQPNKHISPIEAYDLDSNYVNIRFDKPEKTVIYFLSTRCEPCKTNLSNWTQLTDIIKGKNIRVFAIATETIAELRNYAKTNDLNFEVYSAAKSQFKLDYKAFTKPQTIIINETGKVINAYPCILNRINVPRILADLSLSSLK